MRRMLWCLPVLAAVVVTAGCGGGGGGGSVAAITRRVAGQLQWPAALGAVTVTQVQVLEMKTNTGASTVLATGRAVTNTSYEVDNVPADKLAVVQAQGTTGGGITVRLAAMIGQAIGRGRQVETVTVDLDATKTIAAAAADQLAKAGASVTTIAQKVPALETAASSVAATVDFTDPTAVSNAASEVASTTSTITFDTATYWPIRTGDTYAYKVTDSAGGVSGETRTFGAQTTFNGGAAIPWKRLNGSANYWATTASGIVNLGGTDPSANETWTYQPAISLPNTLALGQPVNQTYTETDTNPSGTTVWQATLTLTLAGYESVTVPAGTFANCAKVVMSGSATAGTQQRQESHTWWLAPGVGAVKEINVENGVTDSTLELTAATVNGTLVANTFDPAAYFSAALKAGNQFSYAVTGDPSMTSMTQTISATTFNGQAALQGVESGGYTSYMDPTTGAMLGDKDASGNVTVYQPPLTLPTTLTAGQSGTISTQATYTPAGGQPTTLPASVTFTFVRYEPVTVPAGTFANCAEVTIVTTIAGQAGSTTTLWLAPGVGQVKWTDGTAVDLLTSATVNGIRIPIP